MSLPYNIVRSIPWVVYIIYLVLVFFAAERVAGKSVSGTHTVAVRSFPANHQLQLTDIEPIDQADLVGHYLRDNVKQGEAITPNMVASKPPYTGLPNTLAAIITIPRWKVVRLFIDAKSDIQICRGNEPFVERAEVAAVECNETDCSVVAILPKMQGENIDQKVLSGTTITLPKQSCMSP